METLKRAWSWLNDEPRRLVGMRILQAAIGLLLCFRVATEWRFATFFWGPHGVGAGTTRALFGDRVSLWLLAPFQSDLGVRLIGAGLFVAGLGLILGRFTRLCTAVALLLVLMFEARLAEILDGGDNITRIVLCYGLFLLPAGAKSVRGSLSIFMHNVAVVAITAQICVVYVTAGLMKANGAHWVQGTALYMVSQVEWFSLPSSRWIFRNAVVTTCACYATFFYQLWFPFAIFSRLRILWVFVGICFHVGIAYTMGLIPFSTIMIGLELSLLDDEDWATVRRWVDPAPWRARMLSSAITRNLGARRTAFARGRP